MVARNIPTSTAAKNNFPVQAGQYIWKTIASALSDENQIKKNLHWIFFNSSTKISDQNWAFFTYRHLPSHLKHSSHLNFLHQLLLLCRPCIFVFVQGAFHANYNNMFHFSIVPSSFYYKPYTSNMACILGFFFFQLLRNFEWDLT